jgi:hypothetical protein
MCECPVGYTNISIGMMEVGEGCQDTFYAPVSVCFLNKTISFPLFYSFWTFFDTTRKVKVVFMGDMNELKVENASSQMCFLLHKIVRAHHLLYQSFESDQMIIKLIGTT